jgi:hypothetical protein
MKRDPKYRRAEEVEEESAPCQEAWDILVRQATSWKPNTMFPGTLSSKGGLVYTLNTFTYDWSAAQNASQKF